MATGTLRGGRRDFGGVATGTLGGGHRDLEGCHRDLEGWPQGPWGVATGTLSGGVAAAVLYPGVTTPLGVPSPTGHRAGPDWPGHLPVGQSE